MNIPLAWRTLAHNKRRLGLSLAGIGFVVLLMFMEIGFNNGALDTQIILYQKFNADLVMMSVARDPDYPQQFPLARLYQTCSCPAVKTVIPVYVRPATTWVDPDTGAVHPIRVIGFDARTKALSVDRLPNPALRQPGTALFDIRSRDVYGRSAPGTTVQIGGRSVEIVGQFSLGSDLETDGNLLVDESTYFALFGLDDGPNSVDYGLIQLAPGSDATQALTEIRKVMGEGVQVLPRNDVATSVREYWQEFTPTGFLFQVGVVVGLIIGVIVCYQILFTEISSNLMPFATLKGMGYHNRYLVKVVLQQATFLALLGFIIGMLGAFALYRFLEWSTGLVMYLTVFRAANILVLTLAMCLIAGIMAVGKVIRADPADCF